MGGRAVNTACRRDGRRSSKAVRSRMEGTGGGSGARNGTKLSDSGVCGAKERSKAPEKLFLIRKRNFE